MVGTIIAAFLVVGSKSLFHALIVMHIAAVRPDGIWHYSIFAGACLIISSVLTAVYVLSVVTAFYFRPLSGENLVWGAECHDPDLRMKLPMALIAALVVILGFWSEPLVTFIRSLVP